MSENNETLDGSEQPQVELAYLDETALEGLDPTFATGTSGYVEEQVDVYRRDVSERLELFVNNYNVLVYRTLVAEDSLQREQQTAAELREELEELKNAPAPEPVELSNNGSNDEAYAATVTDLESRLDLVQGNNNELQEYIEKLNEHVEALTAAYEKTQVELQDALDAPVPTIEPTVVTPGVSNVSASAQRILESAAEEAHAHVQRSLEQVAAIEASVQADAQRVIDDAILEAEQIKKDAVLESADAEERLRVAKLETAGIFERIVSFHESQLQQAQHVFSAAKNEVSAGYARRALQEEETKSLESSVEDEDAHDVEDFTGEAETDEHVETPAVEEAEPVVNNVSEQDLADAYFDNEEFDTRPAAAEDFSIEEEVPAQAEAVATYEGFSLSEDDVEDDVEEQPEN